MIVAATLLTLMALPAGVANRETVQKAVARALDDASSRSSLLLESANSGHDGRCSVSSNDGSFRLNIGGQLQTRWLAAWRHDDGAVDPFTSGFQIRRMKLTFDGHIFDESLRFKVTNESRRTDGGMRMSDVFIEKRFESGLSIRAGQFKAPFTREYFDSSRRLLAVERSLVDSVFRLGRLQGAQLGITGDDWRGWVAFTDGFRSENIDFGSDATDWALTGRAEWLPFGSFNVFHSQRGKIDAEPSLRLGGAVHAEERGASVFGPSGRLVSWTGDVAAAGPGWIGLATFVGRENSQATGATLTDWGVTAQLGVWATDQLLPFVRWELLIPDRDRAARSKTNVLTAGVNWYWRGDALKLTVDGVWLIDGGGSSALVGPNTGAGILPPGSGDQAVALRVQAQLLF